ncbi:calcium-activated chloride channel regulator 4A-like [Pollicipes pollicipes]|uniref:calcium-activated chloride channel regulator 4A-like n=1 Tax=Pollicipes pollicipes TaxID=41117 RepID=UPI001884BA4C|nr:calcium-activated chloride channel regulator 4A-like [Pollicipes pollicipes]
MLLANMDVRRAFPILAALLVCASGSRVELVNNGYSGLVIGIDDKVDVLQCHDLLGNLQTLINNASSYLYTATNQRAFFSDVTVVVPSSWPRSCTGADPPGQATTESYLTSDLRVSTAHPVYGSAPWTHQSGLCGQPGAFVQFAAGYVASGDNRTFGDQARVLVHEWAKYRWGVFEEFGYAEDPLYPSFYQQTAGQWRPSGCSDGAVAGSVSPSGCEESSNTCTFVPFMNASNAAVTSSIMYMQALSQVKNFCDDGNHIKAAPTKHNMLCNESSVWEVMQEHKDFRNGSNPPNANSTIPRVDFRVVKASTDRFFFLLESTATMRQQERWDFVSSSIRKFVNWDVPTGIQVGIGHFGADYRTDRNLTTVPNSLMGRGELANLPPIADDVMEAYKSWTTAIDGALAALGRMAAGATIIWVTGNQESSRNQPTAADVDYMIAALNARHARLVVVFYPTVTPGLARVAMETGGDVISVEDVRLGDQTSITVFHSLAAAYVYTLDKYIADKRLARVQVEDRQFVGNGQHARGSFLIDTTLGVNTTLTVLYNTRSEIGYVKLRPPGGQLNTVYTYPDSTNHLQYAPIAQTQGRWEYEIDNMAPSHSSIFVQVTSSSASSEDTVRTEVWTNMDRTGSLNATERPLIIYASVVRGHAPVLDAEVYAVVTRADGQSVRVQLLDNGLGVPDILHGDGIYSRYFTDFGSLTPASQLFIVRVEVGGSRARVVTGRDLTQPRAIPVNGQVPCCGSTIGNVTSVPVNGLRRSASGGGILVFGSTDQQADVYPPNRVTDLRAETDAAEQTITFSWSAPGDDYDKPDTRVSHYEVRFSESRAQLRDHFTDCTSVPHWSQPEPAGTPSLAVIDFHTVDKLLFFAIRGVDEAGNVARISNVVALVLPPPPPTLSPPPPTGTTAPIQPSPPPFDDHLLLIVLLCVAGVILLIVLLALYYFFCYRRRKPDPGAGASRHITTVTVPTVESREPTPVKIAYDLEKEKAVQTISDGQTPSMWTASDILDTRDRRHSPDDSFSNYASGQPLNASQLGTGRARYNSYQTPFVEDMPYDGRSLVSTQPSDSFMSLTSDPRHRNNNTLSEGEPAGWPSDKDSLVQAQRVRGGRLPPPTLPKPRLHPADGSQHGSRASVAGDRRQRNVTQV